MNFSVGAPPAWLETSVFGRHRSGGVGMLVGSDLNAVL
jgi:hypothetical protein